MRHEPGYIIIDTEGTGLFQHRNKETGEVVPSDAPGQPRMAEFAAVLCTADFEFECLLHNHIMPVGWKNKDGTDMNEMPEGAYAVHGLTMDFLRSEGIAAALALKTYVDAIGQGRAVVGWNQQHDGRQVRAELRHAGLDDMFDLTKTTCLMRSVQGSGIKIKKLNGKGGFPGLVDAAAHFGIPYAADRRHIAPEDALVTFKIGAEMHRLGIINEPIVHYASGYKGDQA